MTDSNLVAFLNARLDEDDRAVYLCSAHWLPSRVSRSLREVEAKRRILAAYERAPDWSGGEDVRALAAVYRDHPDYDPEWA